MIDDIILNALDQGQTKEVTYKKMIQQLSVKKPLADIHNDINPIQIGEGFGFRLPCTFLTEAPLKFFKVGSCDM